MIKCIFSINTGRCGSHKLAEILAHAGNCQSFHEPLPIGNGASMRSFLRGRPRKMDNVVRSKIDYISTVNDQGGTYAETNHCFIKGFGWLLPKYIPQHDIGVIILRRPKSEVRDSFLRINTTPLSVKGLDWIAMPDKKDPILTPPRRLLSPKWTYKTLRVVSYPSRLLERMSALLPSIPQFRCKKLRKYEFECLDWYIDEVWEMAKNYRAHYPDIRYFQVSIDDLNRIDKVEKMFDVFGLHASSGLAEIIGVPTNTKQPTRIN